MSGDNQTGNLIKWAVIIGDFFLLNFLLYLSWRLFPESAVWVNGGRISVFMFACNFALVLTESRFHTVIHRRLVSGGDILRRIVQLTIMHFVLTYLLMRMMDWSVPVGRMLFLLDTALFFSMLLLRFLERMGIKQFRKLGRNTRWLTFVGSDPELLSLYSRLVNDPTTGYRVLGYYADKELENAPEDVKHLGTLEYLLENLDNWEKLQIGDELYVCLSRRDRHTVRRLSRYCDRHAVRFYYIPVSVETFRLHLHREFLSDMEVWTTHPSPLTNTVNKAIKRLFDIAVSIPVLIGVGFIYPIIALILRFQSPGPVFFGQVRTGLDGRNFKCYKFRSMHVNAEADKLQATEYDPRKFPFGNFMRKMNIDELPQFWNVLRGDMSVVGPRPHMLAHTEKYSELIEKYMVRHLVKPGVTGWAQVTGFRGETKELWQMEGRVERDLWYIEHWSIWLDLRIIWMTAKSLIVHDKQAY